MLVTHCLYVIFPSTIYYRNVSFNMDAVEHTRLHLKVYLWEITPTQQKVVQRTVLSRETPSRP